MRLSFWALLYSLTFAGTCRTTAWLQKQSQTVVADCTCLVVCSVLGTCMGSATCVHWMWVRLLSMCVQHDMVGLTSIKLIKLKGSKTGLPYHPGQSSTLHINVLALTLTGFQTLEERHLHLCTLNAKMHCIWEIYSVIRLKGCGMGPWLVLVSPCFRENVVATCKIASFFVV